MNLAVLYILLAVSGMGCLYTIQNGNLVLVTGIVVVLLFEK